jgi:trans-2,3-dihydro-3-hydroxyanthranilate isomerase
MHQTEGVAVSDLATLPYVVLDVFAEVPFAGNPLAVVMDAEGLTGDQMLQITREFNLSETAFPLRPTEAERAAGADYTLRIFTPGSEVPFAGHPSVGTAWWLAHMGQIPLGQVGQQCGVGLLPVEVSATGAALTAGPATVTESIDPGRALAAVGLNSSDLVDADVRIASTGLEYVVLLVRPDALDRCRPDMTVLRQEFTYPQEATGIYVVAWDAEQRQARARMFTGDLGQAEDAATGSAALAFGALLVARGVFADGSHQVTIDQGVEMGRPSRLTLTCVVVTGALERLQVAGSVIKIAEGSVAIPPA